MNNDNDNFNNDDDDDDRGGRSEGYAAPGPGFVGGSRGVEISEISERL